MRVFIFFQCLSLLLLKSEGSMQAAVVPVPTEKRAATYAGQSETSISSFNKKHSCELISYTELADQNEYLVTEKVEEDECSNAFARKYNSPSRHYSILLYISPSGDYIHRSKVAQCFYGRVSYKYIQQRVLRVWSTPFNCYSPIEIDGNEFITSISCNKCWH